MASAHLATNAPLAQFGGAKDAAVPLNGSAPVTDVYNYRAMIAQL